MKHKEKIIVRTVLNLAIIATFG